MNTDKYLTFTTRDELFRLNSASIVYFEAEGNYTNIKLRNGNTAVICMNLQKMKEFVGLTLKHDARHFIRVGRKHIINMDHILYIGTVRQRLVLSDGASFEFTLQIPKDALKLLREAYVKHLLEIGKPLE